MVKVAIAGIGSCASSFVQLVCAARVGEAGPGVRSQALAGIRVADIDFVAAFDVDKKKVGLDLGNAIFSPTNAAKHYQPVPRLGIAVEPGPLADGLCGPLEQVIQPHASTAACSESTIAEVLLATRADVLVCYLPTGATEAVRQYAKAAATARVGFVNTTPERIARDEYFQKLFSSRAAPLLGDDTKSMVGATTVHSVLIELLRSKGVEIGGTYQINVGGNNDFLNLSDPRRAATKVASKRNALGASGINATQVLAGPNGHVEYLGDSKVCHASIHGTSVLGSPVSIELTLRVEDSPNSAGAVVDAVRVVKAAKRAGLSGALAAPSGMLFKSPPVPVSHAESLLRFDEFLAEVVNADGEAVPDANV